MFIMRDDSKKHFEYGGRPFCVGPYTVASTYPPGLLAGCPPKNLMFKGIQESLEKFWPGPTLFLEPAVEGQVLPGWTVKVVLFSTPIEEQPPEDAPLLERMMASDGSDLTVAFLVKDHTRPIPELAREALEEHGVVWEDHATDWGY